MNISHNSKQMFNSPNTAVEEEKKNVFVEYFPTWRLLLHMDHVSECAMTGVCVRVWSLQV